MSNYEFSVIMVIDNNSYYVDESINSLINQSLNFEDNIQLIIIDNCSNANFKKIVSDYHSKYNNIFLINSENNNSYLARNTGLKYVKGNYVTFLNANDLISPTTFKEVSEFFDINKDKIDVVSIPQKVIGSEKNYILNSKFINKNRIINLEKDILDIQLAVTSAFIKKDSLKNQFFGDYSRDVYDALFINKILLNKKSYGVIGLNKNAYYSYRYGFDFDSNYSSFSCTKEFFTDKLNNFSKYLLNYSFEKEFCFPDFIQVLILYDLQPLLKSPDFPSTFNKEDIKEFWDCLDSILSNISLSVISKNKILRKATRLFLIYLKNKDFHIEIKESNNEVYLKTNLKKINNLHNHFIHCDFIELNNGFLNFSGSMSTRCDNKFLRVEAIKSSSNGKKETFECVYADSTSNNRRTHVFLSIPWGFSYNFFVDIPIKPNEECNISFKVIYEEDNNKVEMYNPINFKEYCNISKPNHFFIKDSQIVMYKNNNFYHMPFSYSKLFKFSIESILKNIHELNPIINILYIISYLLLFPFMNKKEIWLFADRPTIADDNAKHLFSYAIKQNDNVKKYYIVDKKSKDFKEMLEIDSNIVSFGSFKHKMLYLFANKFISSHVSFVFVNPFYNKNFAGYKSLQQYYLRHGVGKDDLSYSINKFKQNLTLFITSSELEKDSIVNSLSHFDESIIKVFGLSRFDNLKNDSIKKEILFMPTWRTYLKDEASFINSEYYKRLNNFFNNEELFKFIEEKGYKIVFKPHYNLLPYFHLFNINENNVRIAENESYQDLFNHSSLLITDYSSVFFDFSYLKKPVIFYHEGNDYHSEKSYFDYETMGFGEVVKCEEDLVNKIIEYLENGCQMEDKYKERVDNFFKYTDRNNCKRTYDWILEH